MPQPLAPHFANILDALGGPSVTPDDLQQTLDDPTGKALLEWITQNVPQRSDDLMQPDEKLRVTRAALRDIALTKEERDILKQLDLEHVLEEAESAVNVEEETLDEYLHPTQLKTRIESLRASTRLYDQESHTIKMRLKQTKPASQALTQALSQLTASLKSTNAEVSVIQARLSELSIKADVSIMAASESASKLLNELTNPHRDTPSAYIPGENLENDEEIEEEEDGLQHLATIRLSLIEDYNSQIQEMDELANKIPSIEVVTQEIQRLESFLEGRHDEILEAALKAELAKMSKLSDVAATHVFEGVGDAHEVGDSGDVRSILEAAWAADQRALLERRIEVLDKAIQGFEAYLVDPLTSFHTRLDSANTVYKEGEASIGALVEEFEEIGGLIEDAQGPAPREHQNEDAEADLERELIRVLKTCENIRDPTQPPMIMINRQDILSELKSLISERNDAGESVASLKSTLLKALEQRTAAQAPFLAALYANSPLNTSPSLNSSTPIRALEIEGKLKTGDMINKVEALQQGLDTAFASRSGKKRRTAFVEKWGGTSREPRTLPSLRQKPEPTRIPSVDPSGGRTTGSRSSRKVPAKVRPDEKLASGSTRRVPRAP